MTTPAARQVDLVPLDAILELREEYRREMDCQIGHDSWHERGFTNSYQLKLLGEVVGYAAVGGAPGDPRDTLKEFYVLPGYRSAALPLFREVVAVSGAKHVEAQTNDVLLTLMLYDCARDITSDTILFADAVTTTLPAPGVKFRQLGWLERKRVFPHAVEPIGEYGLELDGEVVATGGALYHYNPPYGDVYMEVAEPHRRKGYGAYLVQEVKRVCRERGSVPAARTGVDNIGSRATLQRAGLFPCARILRGRLD